MGPRSVKAGLVMLQMSLESLGASVLLLIVVGSSARRVGCGICCGMSATGMLVDYLAYLLARSSRS